MTWKQRDTRTLGRITIKKQRRNKETKEEKRKQECTTTNKKIYIPGQRCKLDLGSIKKQDPSRWQQANESSKEIAMLIKQTISTEMESLQETVAHMLKDLLEKALNPSREVYGRKWQHSQVRTSRQSC